MKNNKCPFCKTAMNVTNNRITLECKTKINVRSGSKIPHYTIMRSGDILVDFYDFAYITGKNSYIELYDKSGESSQVIPVNIENYLSFSYKELEEKIKKIILFA